MKKLVLTLLAVLIAISLFAQVPQAFKYQAVARSSSGEALSNQEVSFQISILQGSASSTIIYTETHDTITNEFGLVNLEIGNGTLVSGDFTSIDWGSDSYFLQIEMDETGNSNYQLLGTSQLLSVPYSINSGSLTLTDENGKTWNITVDTEGNLQINCFPLPSLADAGTDQDSVCIPATLEANNPLYGEGVWTIVNGAGGSFADTTNPVSEFTGTPGNAYTLRWTITTICDTTFDDVNISFLASPTIADAGPDQLNVVSPITLAANTPGNGTGLWAIINGTGGNIAEPSNPTSSFSGTFDISYTLRWTITTTCDTTFDDVNISFGCPLTVTDYEGNIYNVVKIGSQCWMKENLKTTTYSNGTTIPYVTDNTAWGNLTTDAYAWYDNDISWKDSYGALYNWYTIVDANGLCPTGWHIPTDDEWTILTDFIGGTGSPHGNELKSCRQVNSPLGGGCNTSEHPRWIEHGTHYGTDDYGFSGLPGGFRYYSGPFTNIGSTGSWWSSTDYSSLFAYNRNLHYDLGYVTGGGSLKRVGNSVRCIKD